MQSSEISYIFCKIELARKSYDASRDYAAAYSMCFSKCNCARTELWYSRWKVAGRVRGCGMRSGSLSHNWRVHFDDISFSDWLNYERVTEFGNYVRFLKTKDHIPRSLNTMHKIYTKKKGMVETSPPPASLRQAVAEANISQQFLNFARLTSTKFYEIETASIWNHLKPTWNTHLVLLQVPRIKFGSSKKINDIYLKF